MIFAVLETWPHLVVAILQEWNWMVKPSILQEIDGEMASCITVHEDLLVVSAEILVESAVN